jgi:hypothetical protein
MYKTIITKQTSYDLRVSKINFFCHHLHKKKSNKLHSYYDLFIFFFEHAIFES